MKQFITKISYFFLILFICMLGISQLPISDEFVIKTTKETSYEKLAWALKKFENPEQLNGANVFIGPSLIQGDINDSALTANGIKSVNMGINHNGFDLDHYITNRVLERSAPQKIYLYRPRDNKAMLHPMMPLLVGPIDYYRLVGQFPVEYIRTFIPKRIYFALQYIFSFATGDNAPYHVTEYGFRPEENIPIKSEAHDEEVISREIAARENYSKNKAPETTRERFAHNWDYYLHGNQEPVREKSFQLVEASGIPVSEIYMPAYYDAIIDDKTDNRTYFDMPVGYHYPYFTLSDYSFLNDSNYWIDHHHLTQNGTVFYTDSLIVHLK